MTWTVLVIGATCCAADYGLHWLEQALLGCCDSGSSCSGESLELFDCCPDAEQTRPQFLAEHRRVLRRVALTSGPTVIARDQFGDACASGGCAAGGSVLTVEFTLTAAVPDLWTDTVPLLDVDLPIDDDDTCVTWCLTGSTLPECQNGCLGAPCIAATDPSDPSCSFPAPPGVTGPDTCFCVPIASERACYDVDLSTRPGWSCDVPIIVLRAGSTDLRDVRLTFYEKPDGTTMTCDQIADANRCTNSGEFFVTFVPANGALTIDGQTGQYTTEYQGGCFTSSSVFGDNDGGPAKVPDLCCSSLCFCIETSLTNPPAANASVSLGVSGRRY